ncbi:MAG: hypothetical protein LWW76_02660 [Burkholderiales bacterium]|nr:hypothetical protein [Burkholderiales bacterium]
MDIKLADTKTIKEIANVLFYPMTGIAAMVLFNPSLHWDIDPAGLVLSDYQLFLRFILTFAFVSGISCFFVFGFGVAITYFLIDVGWTKLIRLVGWFLISLGLLGLFAIPLFPPLAYLPQIIYATLLVWGVHYVSVYEKI